MMTRVLVGAVLLGAALSGPALYGGAMLQQKAPELEGGTAWFNTDKPVKLAELRGKIVLLEFWTYC